MSRRIAFVKMSGAGNDFIVLDAAARDALGQGLEPFARRACRRGVSVGADGVLLVEGAGRDRVRVSFYNPDGSAAFCGNGSRCAARFARLRGLAGDAMTLETLAGEVPARIEGASVIVRLPAPEDRGATTLEVGAERVTGRFVLAGAPHFVVLGESFPEGALERWGPVLRRAAALGPQGVNVDLVRREAPATLRVRTWERGVEGETLSCGSGAVASAFAASLAGGPPSTTVVPASGIPLTVELLGSGGRPGAALLRGDARVLFEAGLDDEALAGFP